MGHARFKTRIIYIISFVIALTLKRFILEVVCCFEDESSLACNVRGAMWGDSLPTRQEQHQSVCSLDVAQHRRRLSNPRTIPILPFLATSDTDSSRPPFFNLSQSVPERPSQGPVYTHYKLVHKDLECCIYSPSPRDVYSMFPPSSLNVYKEIHTKTHLPSVYVQCSIKKTA